MEDVHYTANGNTCQV